MLYVTLYRATRIALNLLRESFALHPRRTAALVVAVVLVFSVIAYVKDMPKAVAAVPYTVSNACIDGGVAMQPSVNYTDGTFDCPYGTYPIPAHTEYRCPSGLHVEDSSLTVAREPVRCVP